MSYGFQIGSHVVTWLSNICCCDFAYFFHCAACQSFRIIRSTLFEGHVIIGMANVYYAYNAFLITLQVLHIIWFYMILQMAYRYVIKGNVRLLYNSSKFFFNNNMTDSSIHLLSLPSLIRSIVQKKQTALKKCALKLRLDCQMCVICLSDGGRLFHARGQATWKVFFLNAVLVPEHQKTLTGEYSAAPLERTQIGVKTYVMFSGKVPFTAHRDTHRQRLYLTW